MLTSNLWAVVGLELWWTLFCQENHKPPYLPIAVVVQFDNYSGPQFMDSMPNCVPICPLTASTFIGNQVHERQQLPLRLSLAITIHRSQGLLLPKAWIYLGKSEKVASISYVAISRVRSLDRCVIEPMNLECLQNIENGKNLPYRLEEEQRLQYLADQTD